jgi:hypothetical protein
MHFRQSWHCQLELWISTFQNAIFTGCLMQWKSPVHVCVRFLLYYLTKHSCSYLCAHKNEFAVFIIRLVYPCDLVPIQFLIYMIYLVHNHLLLL